MKEAFLLRMKEYLKDEYAAYEESLSQEMFRGLRVNTTKISVEDLRKLNLCKLSPSRICPQSFYILDDVQGLGNHPAHLAGLFYMQEPSASSAVEVLDVQKGDWVLDLCAAPGGKSSQIAAKLHHSGFLVSNEIDSKRAQILLSNMERLGFGECMITNARPQDLCSQMHGCFDKILVDAPCSGEGMFKKHAKAMEDWSIEHVRSCAKRQISILNSAYEALRCEGVMVYSTCTYSMEENEEVVYAFLQQHPDMELVDANVTFGRPGFTYKDLPVERLRRIFPMDQGEGHFVARFIKHGACERAACKEVANKKIEPFVKEWIELQIGHVPPYLIAIQDKIYAKETPFITLKNIRILRQGILCGEIVKKRFEPHQHFYSAAIHQNALLKKYNMSEEECQQFLTGNVLYVSGYKGYIALCWHGYVIGFGKGDGTLVKNKYPKGLRLHG